MTVDQLIEVLDEISETPIHLLPALRARLASEVTLEELKQIDVRINICRVSSWRPTTHG